VHSHSTVLLFVQVLLMGMLLLLSILLQHQKTLYFGKQVRTHPLRGELCICPNNRSPFWIAGSLTNLDKDKVVNTTQIKNLTASTVYQTVGAKRWNLGYNDRLVFTTVSGDSFVDVFHYDWLTPLTTSATPPRKVPLPPGLSRVDQFSCLDSNGGAYASSGRFLIRS
jgi:hypothetical protein